ncbi:hypothetical protein EON80_12990 [bacterium]|nr:MAG: hypothetical protein EON80_12990 [bacterium]
MDFTITTEQIFHAVLGVWIFLHMLTDRYDDERVDDIEEKLDKHIANSPQFSATLHSGEITQQPGQAGKLEKTTFQRPSVGRIVHYVLEDGEHRPAMVTEVPGLQAAGLDGNGVMNTVIASFDSGIIGLNVFLSPHDEWGGEAVTSTVAYAPGTPFDESGTEEHSWHWPERV